MTRKSRKPLVSDLDDYFDSTVAVKKPEPKTLTADDLVWNYSTDDGRKDLAEWLQVTFNPDYPRRDTKRYARAYRTLCKVVTERFGKPVRVLHIFLEYTKRNRRPSLEWQAACWNETLARMGYDVPGAKRADPEEYT